MDERVKKLWVKALRSGKYVQAEGYLKTGGGFCCLGVLCDLHSKETKHGWDDDCLSYMEYDHMPPPEVLFWAGLYGDDALDDLTDLNDNGCDFHQIAACIENGL